MTHAKDEMRIYLGLLALAFAAGGCFSIKPQNGALSCSAAGQCPSGFYCSGLDRACWRMGTSPAPRDMVVAPDLVAAGTVDLGEPQAPPADLANGVSDMAPPWVCHAGDARCFGLRAQSCDPATGQWIDNAVCPYLCSAGACTGECAPMTSTARCNLNDVQTCDATGHWVTQMTCPQVCTSGECKSCVPATKQCSGTILETCNAGGTWDQSQCADACLAATPQCGGVCKPGLLQCSGATLQVCDANGSWTFSQGCSNACVDPGNGAAFCGACQPSTFQCKAGVLNVVQQCSATGTWVDGASKCPFVCDTTQASHCGGVCVPGAATRCNGNVQQSCTNAGQWQDQTSCTFVCSSTTNQCGGECRPGVDRRCSGNQPQKCSSAGLYVNDTACSAQQPVCSSGVCGGVCVPTHKQCSSSTQLQQCDATGAWQNSQVCLACIDPGDGSALCGDCQPGQFQCNPNVANLVQQCSSAGKWVDNATPCAFVCDLKQANHCGGSCVPGSKSCSGNLPQLCDATGTYQNGAACTADKPACVNGTCGGVCVPNVDKSCIANVPQSCNSLGQWQAGSTCPNTAPQCGGGACGLPPSCNGLAATCLALGNGAGGQGCCSSAVVPGGSVWRAWDATQPVSGQLYSSTVSDFRLDTYEVTVGRFRKFVDAGQGTQLTPPADGAGAHPKIAGSGWSSAWNLQLAGDSTALRTRLKNTAPATFTDAAGANEALPVNNVDWYTAMAFCIWDGGRLPTDSEWNYAAAGGSEQRVYPWPSASNMVRTCADPNNCTLADVSIPGGQSLFAKWGQYDLAGNVGEWMVDVAEQPVASCVDCADLNFVAPTPLCPGCGSTRMSRGGSFEDVESSPLFYNHVRWRVLTYGVSNEKPTTATAATGLRCARQP